MIILKRRIKNGLHTLLCAILQTDELLQSINSAGKPEHAERTAISTDTRSATGDDADTRPADAYGSTYTDAVK